MEAILATYSWTVLSLGAIGALLVLQLLVADILGVIRNHVPGTSVEEDHGNVLFRVSRAYANTNESIGGFTVLTVFSLASAAEPTYLNAFTATYVACRAGHMASYYANLTLVRSAFFASSVVALIGVGVVGLIAWI